MNTFTTKMRFAATTYAATLAIALTGAFAGTSAQAAGFQNGTAADPEGKPLPVAIWYPSATAPAPVSMGPTTMTVAMNAPLQGKDLPLVVMSHGNGGSAMSHFDTAIALADAGYVVVAVTHTGDNYADQSRAMDVLDRSRQMSRVIDHMLQTWQGHASIDPARIGIFGFSSGGFTALASVGAVPDFSKIGPNCAQYPGDYVCNLITKHGGNASAPNLSAITPATTPVADSRIKAAVVAAPALSFTYSRDGLKNVKVPMQLWRAADDTVLPHPRYAENVRIGLPQQPEYQVVPNAGHFDFLAPCSAAFAAIAPPICTSAAGFDRAAFHVKFNAQVVTFFNKTLAAAKS